MGIDVTKLDGVLKTLAKISDSDGNNQIENGEVSIFKGYADYALQAGQINEKDYKNIFGLEADEQKPAATATNPITLSKKDVKRNRNAVKDSVKEMIENGTAPEDLIGSLKKKYINPEYTNFINDVEYILNAVNATKYNSKEDVEKIHDTVKEQLKKDGRWDEFNKDVLNYLEDQAKEAQINKEFKALTEKYNQVKATMAKTDIVKNQGDNFKAYVEILKDELQTKGADGKKAWNESYTKEAFEYLEQYAKDDAKLVVESRMPDTKAHSSRKIKNELNALNKGGDDYQKDAVKDLKTDRKIFARKNTVEDKAKELEHTSRKDLQNELGKDLFEKLNRAYLPTVMNSDGTYDLSKLSDEIMTRVGADYQVNRSQDNEMSEMTNIKRHLTKVTGQELSNKEVKKLLNLADIKREKKDRSVKTIAKNVLPSLITGAITGLVSSNYEKIQQTVTLTIDSKEIADKLINELKAQGIEPGVTELTKGKVGIKVFQEVLKDDRLLNTLTGAGIGVLTSALWSLVLGTEKDEKSCMSISDYDINDTKYTNADEYKEYIGQIYKNPAKVKAIHTLVDTYQAQYGDEWHVHYQQALRDMAGIGSKLNPEECRMMKYQGKADDSAKPDTPSTPAKPDKTAPQSTQVPPCRDEKCAAELEDNTFTYTKEGGDTWKELVKAFYPCLEEDYGMYGKDGAIRRLKKALSYNEDGTFNKETYKALLEGGDLPKTMKLPAQIDGCDRVDNAKVKKTAVHGNGKAKIQSVGFGYFTATDGCDDSTAVGTSKEQALANLKQKTGKTYTNEAELLK